MATIRNSVVKLLNGCHDELAIRTKLLYQCSGVICRIHAALFEAIKFSNRLRVEVVAVYYKNNFVDIG